MTTISEQQLKDILDKHGKWLRNEEGGSRADLSSADLSYADLSSADLSYADLSSADLSSADLRSADLRSADLRSADLSYANLSYADLSSANLRSADLSYANLSYANLSSADLSSADLSYADLSSIKEDFFKRLELAKHEVKGLYDYLQRGKVDGSSYEGECACFVGTIANVAHENYKKLSCGLKPESNSPTEKWFLAIRKGDIPQSNKVSDITADWIEEFCVIHDIKLPEYRIASSDELVVK